MTNFSYFIFGKIIKRILKDLNQRHSFISYKGLDYKIKYFVFIICFDWFDQVKKISLIRLNLKLT